ncbi:MAG: hypothetical protein ACTSQK_08050 [Candidatus Heimdallarchaeota archaeon]
MDRKLLLMVLKKTKDVPYLLLDELKEETTRSKINSFLKEIEQIGIQLQPTIDGNLQITREQRAQLVIFGARNGVDWDKIIKQLSWQEFELLTTMIGDEFGYVAKTGLNFSTEERKYQIDVILKNAPYIILIDCKHFGGTGKQSVLRNAATEQVIRTEALAANINELKGKISVRKWKKGIVLPMIVTWLDDSVYFHENVPVVPFTKLHSFFTNFYLYIDDIYQIPVIL